MDGMRGVCGELPYDMAKGAPERRLRRTFREIKEREMKKRHGKVIAA